MHEQIPIFVGAAGACGHDVVPAVGADAAVAVLLLALLWSRRRTLEYLVTGHWTGLSQIDLALIVIPVTVVLVVLGGVNANSCAAQSLLPVAVPLALGVASILVERTRWRVIAAVVAAAWLVVSGVAATGTLQDARAVTTSGTPVPTDLAPGIALLEEHDTKAVWADFSLSRLLAYFSDDTLPVGEYGGYEGFVKQQQQVETALDPSWVFVAGDPNIARFLAACSRQSITYATYSGGGLQLYTSLSGPLEPADVFIGRAAQTS